MIQSVADGSQTILPSPRARATPASRCGRPIPRRSTTASSSRPAPPVDDDIYKQAADGSGVATPVVTGTTDDYQPAISPDGQSLCFTRGAFGTTAAKVMRSTVTGTNVTTIANSGLGDYNCAWSPDGTKIAYVQGVFGNGDLMVKNADGSGTPTALVTNVAGPLRRQPRVDAEPVAHLSGPDGDPGIQRAGDDPAELRRPTA